MSGWYFGAGAVALCAVGMRPTGARAVDYFEGRVFKLTPPDICRVSPLLPVIEGRRRFSAETF